MSNYDDLLNNTPANEQSGQLSKEEYTAKKQAEREAIFKMADNAALEVAGDGGRLRQYLDVQAAFDRYGTVNALLIMAQKPESTRLGSFDYWKARGSFVKPGQKGISILEPQEYTKEDGTQGVGFNIKKVFDASQVDMRPARISLKPKYSERQLLKALIDKAPVKVSGVDVLPGNAGAITDPDTGEICVRKGMGFADTFRGVAQELAFADAAASHDTQAAPAFSAYCASYMICKKHGVDTQGFDFTDSPEVFEGMDVKDVKGELTQIRDSAEDISKRMERQLEAAQKTARQQEAR